MHVSWKAKDHTGLLRVILRRDVGHTMTANKRRGPTDGRTDRQTDTVSNQRRVSTVGWVGWSVLITLWSSCGADRHCPPIIDSVLYRISFAALVERVSFLRVISAWLSCATARNDKQPESLSSPVLLLADIAGIAWMPPIATDSQWRITIFRALGRDKSRA